MASAKSVVIFPDGTVAAFDYSGEQIPELQKNFVILLLELWESKGADPMEFGKIEIFSKGQYFKLIPFRKQDGGWNYHLEQ